MSDLPRRHRRRLLRAVAAAFVGLLPPKLLAAAPQRLEDVFKGLAALGERRAEFIERRHSSLLRQPAETRGTLHFKPPDLLARDVVAPRAETVRIDGNSVTLHSVDASGRPVERRMQLAFAPQLAWLAQTLRALLGGRLAELQQLYFVEWEPGSSGWKMALTPRDASLSALVTRIVVFGSGPAIERIEIAEASGDRVELALTPIR